MVKKKINELDPNSIQAMIDLLNLKYRFYLLD